MKKLILISSLLAVAACGTCNHPSISAERTCLERGYAKGSKQYKHCIVDENEAVRLDKENRKRM